MKHIHYIILALVLSSCTAKLADKESSFEISVKDLSATKATLVVEPSNRDACYMYGIISSDMDSYWKMSDRENMRFQLDFIRERMEDAKKEGVNVDFAGAFCYKGGLKDRLCYLSPGTDYRVIVFQVDPSTCEAIGKPYSSTFRTKALIRSDITFQVAFGADSVTITPSGEDSYYWDYEESETIEEEFGTPELFFNNVILTYEEYGFINYQTDSGPCEWVFTRDSVQKMREGVEYTLCIAAYADGDLTTDITTLQFIYHKDTPCEVLP